MQNEAQYDFDRKAAKISALSSNNLDKYEYLSGEDLGIKLSTVEQAKFKCSPLGKIFNRELDKDDKKEGLFKRLKHIEDTNLTQLQAIKDQREKQLRELKNIDKSNTVKHNYGITLDEAIDDQAKLEKLIIRVENYKTKIKKEKKNKVLESAIKLFDARKDIIVFFF